MQVMTFSLNFNIFLNAFCINLQINNNFEGFLDSMR